jgi:low temperature requirement protein LtrA
VTPLELFFDLVFVLSFTQVTATMAEHPNWEGLGEGMLALAAVWWAWIAFAWLTNEIDPNENLNRLLIFTAMGAMLIVSLALPEAFGSKGILFGCAYFVVRSIHLMLYLRQGRLAGDTDLLGGVFRLAPGLLLGAALLIVAGAFEGETRALIWIVALAIDYGTPTIVGTRGFHIHPSHYVERYGLVIILALGESIVAVGVGAGFELDAAEITAAILAIAASCALWWQYFDIVALVAERRLTEAETEEQTRLALQSYSYLHFPMIAGIVLLALGVEQTLAHVDEPLETVPAVALCGGPALYLLAHIAFRLRNVGTLATHRLVAVFALLALIPLALEVDSLIMLGAVAAVLVVTIAYQAIRFREARARVRAQPEMSLAEMRGREPAR